MYFDIGIGLLVGLLGSIISGEQSLWLVIFGALSALAPDIDFILYLIKRRGKIDHFAHDHRDMLHKPLLFSAGIGFLIGYFSPIFGWVWFFGSLWHFIHDTFDGGWGIQWAHPFKHDYFTLASYSPQHHFKTKEEQTKIAAQYGNPNWLEEGYFKINPRLIAELIIFTIAIILTLLWIH